MADESSDLFLLLINPTGDVVAGETQDEAMSEAGMEIDEFEVSFGKSAVAEKDNKFQDAVKKLESQTNEKDLVALLKKQREELRHEIEASQAEIQKLQDQGIISPEMKQTFSIKKYVDTASPALMRAYHASCVNKSYLFKLAVVSSFRAGGMQHPYFVATFGGVRMLSYKMSMSSPLPTEDIDFAFGQCQFEYSSQDESGASKTASSYAWDFIQRETWVDAPQKTVAAR